MKKLQIGGIVALMVLAGSMVHADNINGVNIDFVGIGSAGNAPNTDSYGSVDYDYRISTYEISYAQFAASGLGGGNENEWVPSAGADAPVTRVNWNEAAMYCNWLTSGDANDGAYTISGGAVTGIDRDAAIAAFGMVYVMPTENEWYKAAYYNTNSGTYHTYANLSDSQPSMNVDTRYGNALADGPWGITNGAVELNGTKNMMGNMIEHTETLDGGEVVYRGGGFFQPAANLQASWRITDVKDPSPDYTSVGMRIVAIPEPGTISLMSLSTVGLFLTRSMRRRKRLGQTLMPIRQEHLCDTFSTEQEFRARADAVEEQVDYLQILIDSAKDGWLRSWAFLRDSYQSVDKAFWNRMVVVHERKVQRRIALRNAFRKKALDSLDAFLARIMK